MLNRSRSFLDRLLALPSTSREQLFQFQTNAEGDESRV